MKHSADKKMKKLKMFCKGYMALYIVTYKNYTILHVYALYEHPLLACSVANYALLKTNWRSEIGSNVDSNHKHKLGYNHLGLHPLT